MIQLHHKIWAKEVCWVVDLHCMIGVGPMPIECSNALPLVHNLHDGTSGAQLSMLGF